MGIYTSTGKPPIKDENSLQRVIIHDSQIYSGGIVYDPCVYSIYSDMVYMNVKNLVLLAVSMAPTGRRRPLLRMLRTCVSVLLE
jgi:hypothetical protein